MLTASVSHEMLGPLGANVQISERLLQKVKDESLRKIINLNLVSSKLVMCHANDLVDQSILENGVLTPAY